jgi:DNA invertase Pin-like site-specific DNA recombinase
VTVQPSAPADARSELAEIGEARKAKRASEIELGRVLERIDEKALMQQLRDAGANTSEIARVAGCDRQWVYQMIGAGPVRRGVRKAEG